MATKINITKNKIIFDGHADTIEECNTITSLVNVLDKSADFLTIKKKSGYAEFNVVTENENKLFPPSSQVTILNNPGNAQLAFFDTSGMAISLTLTVTDTGCNGEDDSGNTYTWTYTGSRYFVGFATQPDSTDIVYNCGDTIFAESTSYTLYIVEQSTPPTQAAPTYRFKHHPQTLPILNAPTISIDSDRIVSITNPSTNGNFATSFAFYCELGYIDSVGGTMIELDDYFQEEDEPHTIWAVACGTGFNNSVASNEVTYLKPSGYTVTIRYKIMRMHTYDYGASSECYYSLDNGSNWTQLTPTTTEQSVVVTARQIKFKGHAVGYGASNWTWLLFSTTGFSTSSYDIMKVGDGPSGSYDTTLESNNITLSSTATYYITECTEDD